MQRPAGKSALIIGSARGIGDRRGGLCASVEADHIVARTRNVDGVHGGNRMS